MDRFAPTVFAMLSALPIAANAQCQLCAPAAAATAAPSQALTVEIETTLDFARAAHDGRGNGGQITIDAQTGERHVSGLLDLGGLGVRGIIRVTGAPFARVGVTLPARATLSATDGSTAEIVNLRADLGPDPQLDASGRLTVGFGGRLTVRANAAGDFRGRIPVTANYR